MNNLDKQYTDLLQNILDNGVIKSDRTGTGIKSIFGVQIRHNMQEGFPLLTTKKMAWKQIVTELIWFLRGDTNIRYLVKNNCHIWDGDAYKNFAKTVEAKRTLNYTRPLLTKEEFINEIKIDPNFAKTWGDLGPIYGKQWRNWGGELMTKRVKEEGKVPFSQNVIEGQIDQIQNLIKDLKNNPDSRRLLVNAWNVGEIDQMVLPPCHYGFQVYTRELTFEERLRQVKYDKEKFSSIDEWISWYNNEPNEFYYMGINYTKDTALTDLGIPTRAISLMWNQRSVDTFLGLPFNIASYGLLLSIIAEIVNMVPDQLIGSLGDTHLYLNHLEQAKEQISRTSFDLPKLTINTEFWLTESGECGVGPLSGDIDALSRGMEIGDFQIENYQSHPKIEAPLSN